MNNDRGPGIVLHWLLGQTQETRNTSWSYVDFEQRGSRCDRQEGMQIEGARNCRNQSDERGSVTLEYVVLLSVVAVGCSLAVASLGVPLVQLFVTQEVWVALAVP